MSSQPQSALLCFPRLTLSLPLSCQLFLPLLSLRLADLPRAGPVLSRLPVQVPKVSPGYKGSPCHHSASISTNRDYNLPGQIIHGIGSRLFLRVTLRLVPWLTEGIPLTVSLPRKCTSLTVTSLLKRV